MAKIQINYKSGRQIIVTADTFAVTTGLTGDLSEINAENVAPHALFVGINEIESVWEIK